MVSRGAAHCFSRLVQPRILPLYRYAWTQGRHRGAWKCRTCAPVAAAVLAQAVVPCQPTQRDLLNVPRKSKHNSTNLVLACALAWTCRTSSEAERSMWQHWRLRPVSAGEARRLRPPLLRHCSRHRLLVRFVIDRSFSLRVRARWWGGGGCSCPGPHAARKNTLEPNKCEKGQLTLVMSVWMLCGRITIGRTF